MRVFFFSQQGRKDCRKIDTQLGPGGALKLNIVVVGGRPGKGLGGNLGVTDPKTR